MRMSEKWAGRDKSSSAISLARARSRRNLPCSLCRQVRLSRLLQLFAGRYHATLALGEDGFQKCARGVPHFLLEGFVTVQLVMAGGVRLPIADIAIHLGKGSCWAEIHGAKPVGEAA